MFCTIYYDNVHVFTSIMNVGGEMEGVLVCSGFNDDDPHLY